MSKQRVVMLGDSLTFRNNWSDGRQGLIYNHGIDGDGCAGVWSRLDDVVLLKPDKVFLMIGINDFLRGAAPDEILQCHKRIWEELKKKLPSVRLYIQSLLPYMEEVLPSMPGGFSQNLILRGLNVELKKNAELKGHVFIDLFSLMADEDLQLKAGYSCDGLHLSPQGYDVWCQAIGEFMDETVTGETR